MLLRCEPLTVRKLRSAAAITGTKFRTFASRPARGRPVVRCEKRSFSLIPIGREDEKLTFTGKITVGKSSSADLRIEHPQVEAEHAYIEESQGRLYCTALAGDTAESIAQRASTALAGDEDAFQISMTDTWTWLQDRQLLRGVQYLCPPGGKLAFGDETVAYKIDFDEYSSASQEMFFNAMVRQLEDLASAPDEVKEFVSDFTKKTKK